MSDESNVVSFERKKKPIEQVSDFEGMLANLMSDYRSGKISEDTLIGNLSVELKNAVEKKNIVSTKLANAEDSELSEIFAEQAAWAYKEALIYRCYSATYSYLSCKKS